MQKNKSIALKPETVSRLKSYGGFDDSYDSVINRILDEYEKMKDENEVMANHD